MNQSNNEHNYLQRSVSFQDTQNNNFLIEDSNFSKQGIFHQQEAVVKESILIHNQSKDSKMAVFQGVPQTSHMIGISMGYGTYPNTHYSESLRQNLVDQTLQSYQNVNSTMNFHFQDHKTYDLLDKDCAFDIDKQKEMGNIFEEKCKLNPEMAQMIRPEVTQISLGDVECMDLLQDFNTCKQPHSHEMAPLIQNKFASKGFSSGILNRNQPFNPAPPFQFSSAPHLESSSRVNIDYFGGRSDQYLTPQKISEGQSPLFQRHIYTDLKNEKSTKKANLKNLEQISRDLLPIHIFKEKSSKPKIISYSDHKPSRTQNRGKANKISISKIQTTNQTPTNDKKLSPIVLAVDNNRRIAKAKCKKKNLNKTEPSIQHEELQNNLETFRSALSVQVYEIQCLNSLEEFNKKIKDHRKSFSLMGNNQDQTHLNSIKKNEHEQPTITKLTGPSQINEAQKSQQHQAASQAWSPTFGKNHDDTMIHSKTQDDQNNTLQSKPSQKPPSKEVQPPNQQLFQVQGLKGGLPQSIFVERRVKCNCTKNSCRQGYCECLKNSLACDPLICQCVGCENTEDNHELRSEIKQKQTKQGTKEGCNCKNSQCLKKYCECYQLGRICNPSICKCKDCGNNDIIKLSHSKIFANRYTQ